MLARNSMIAIGVGAAAIVAGLMLTFASPAKKTAEATKTAVAGSSVPVPAPVTAPPAAAPVAKVAPAAPSPAAAPAPAPAQAALPQTKKPRIFADIVRGVAVGGYDAVSYFTGTPTIGSPQFTLEHAGATWRFASAANRDLFAAAPTRYAPQYGGYCAWAVSQGYTAKGDPQVWKVAGGKLYLNFNTSVQKGWEKDIPGHIAKGDANWPKVLDK